MRTIFVHHIHAVADALSMGLLDCQTDMTAKPARGHQSGRKLACVETDMDFGIEIVEEADYAHVQRIVSHRGVTVFRLYEIATHNSWIGRGDFKSEQCLSKDGFPGAGSQHLVDITLFYLAGRKLVGLATMLTLPTRGFNLVPIVFCGGNVIAQAVSQHVFAKGLEIVVPLYFLNDCGDTRNGGICDQLEILFVLGGGTSSNFVEPFAGVSAIRAGKFAESIEEVIVAADSGRGHKAAHGESVDQRIVQMLIFERLCSRGFALATSWRRICDRLRLGEGV